MFLTKKGRLAVTVATMSVVLTVAMSACSSDDDSSSSEASVDSAAALGTPNKATGAPITLGFITSGKTDVVDTSAEKNGAEAAAGYATNYLGGINDHPVTIKTCDAGLTPAGGTDCANQMVQAKVSAVVLGGIAIVDSIVDPLAKAGLPLFIHQSASQKTLSTPGVYSFGNALASFGLAATQAQDAGANKAAMITASIPAAEGAARTVGTLVYGNAKVQAEVVSIPVGTPDMTPQISAALNNGAGQFFILGSDAFCVSALKAIRTLEPDAPITIPERCITPGAEGSIPNGYEGITVSTTANYDPATPDMQIFTAALKEYGGGIEPDAVSAYGYMPTLALIQALNATKVTDFTAANIIAGVRTAPALPYPLGSGITYQCNGNQIPTSPYICSSDALAGTATQDGTLTDVKPVKIAPSMYAPPGS